ncbi:TRAP transporter substrate-binding protein DctP [Aestuariirhabdus litorea]|uniref:C4-dicarboxylate ABC transporter substrate-binding protein n=1 Tax=Aestuariirhabdus litorea TaxID=2528527 RepID=A0A3P3VIT7_9GAMM|nr:TRAP transporter substrate-binding protein DctP [Aestuariirhabdus litorea]RRJ82645.1 hypothetical protein D0544_12340 [Aestuariirhabdus litorea]RWW92806.1 hypothetical protein DZC74_12320 [Endozoicomonadaceae bacterium GTF-13]
MEWTPSKMLRRLVLMFFLFAIIGCDQQRQPDQYQWRLQSHALETTLDYQELLLFTERVAKMSNGRLQITPHPGGPGALASGPDIFTAVAEGDIEMGNGWPNWWSAQHPAWAVMNAGPFDFMNIDASMMFFFSGEGTKLANELSNSKGILWRPAWWPGMEFGLLSREPIRGLADMKGKRVRIGPGLPSEVLAEASGSFAIPLVPEEIRPALSKGELDAVEWTTTGGAWDLQLGHLSPFAIVPAIWQPSVLSDFLINQQAYNQLPPDLQTILETAIQAYTLTTTLHSKVKDIEALGLFRNNGTRLTQWSPEDIERWRTASNTVLERYRNRDEFSARLIDSKRAFKATYDDYYQVFGPYDKTAP